MMTKKKNKYRTIDKLSHQDKMLIYNTWKSDLFLQTELVKKFNVSIYTLKKVIKEVEELIQYKLYGKPPKRPTHCNLCGGKVILNRCDKNKSKSGWVYYCPSCHAWVGTSTKNYKDALGELGNHEMRKRRKELHQWFDKLWSNKQEREMYYYKLAIALGKTECHFSQMSLEELDKAEKIVKKWWLEKYDR